MVKYVTRYGIRATPNSGNRKMIFYSNTKAEAKTKLKKILSKPKLNGIVNGKKIYRTSYRNAQSGGGINNPRIVKYRGIK